MKTGLGTLVGHLRLSGWLEGVSFLLLLFIAMPLKYWGGYPEGVRYTGMAHGVLFIWYVGAVLLGRGEKLLSFKQMCIALAGSLLPFGTFYADRTIFRNIR